MNSLKLKSLTFILLLPALINPIGTPERSCAAKAPVKTPPRGTPTTPERKRSSSEAGLTTPPTKRSSPGRPPRQHIHITPITPGMRRHLTTTIRENSLVHQAMFSDEALAALENIIKESIIINGRIHQHGALLAEKRATYYFPYQLRARIAEYRNPSVGGNPTFLGGEDNPMSFSSPGKKGSLRNQFQHIIPLPSAIEVIKIGNTFIRRDTKTGKPLLVFIAPATLVSNEPAISGLLEKWDEIQIIFGYLPADEATTNPYFLFHAMGDKSSNRGSDLIPVSGVAAYLDETTFPERGGILRFDLTGVKKL